MASPLWTPRHPSLLLLFFVSFLLPCFCQYNHSSSAAATSSPPPRNMTSPGRVPGCGAGLDPVYRYLCDRRAAWGIVLETLASAGFLLSFFLLLGLAVWALCLRCASGRRRSRGSSMGGMVACVSMFLLATAGIFATTFSFVVGLSAHTCPTRVFLFSVLFSLAFSCLLARCLALLGFAAARGWGEAALALGLFTVQVIISTQWLILVLVRDGRPCQYSQGEFTMLQIYVLCLLALGLLLTLHLLCRSGCSYGYGHTGAARQHSRVQAVALLLTLLLSAAVWVVWMAMLTRGNWKLGRQPQWDDPVLGVALVVNGWVLLIGHGLLQVAFLCQGEARSRDAPLSFSGWTSPSADIPGLGSPKEGRENGSFESEGDNRRGRRTEQSLRSPYESGFSMAEIDMEKDYSIPRPQATNYTEPYDGYYERD